MADMEELTKEEKARPESAASREQGKKADPPRPGPDYVAWRIRWEEKFGFGRRFAR